MWTYRHQWRVQNLFLQDEIVRNKIEKYIQECIEPATGRIPESLHGHELPEKGIKVIDHRYNKLFHHVFQKRCKGISNRQGTECCEQVNLFSALF
jgi:hypothetical protein